MYIQRDVLVAMRDGVELACDIYFPACQKRRVVGRFPVILERTPYNKNAPSRSEVSCTRERAVSRAELALFFVRRGYIVIYQDCRGTYRSGGKFIKYVNEGQDGFDMCEWIVRQAWSNGRIATKGLSYAAHTQAALASAGAPGVVAMLWDSGGFSNAFQGGIRQGGAFELKQAMWAFNRINETARSISSGEAHDLRVAPMRECLTQLHQWRRGYSPLSSVPEYEKYFFEQWEHGNFDAYWKQIGLCAQAYYEQFPAAAIIFMSSWFDPYSRSAAENFSALSRRFPARPLHLILGPWRHGDRSHTHAGDVEFGECASLDYCMKKNFMEMRLDWFDQHLKARYCGEVLLAKVKIFVMGGGCGKKNTAGRMQHGGRWRDESDWPLPDTVWSKYYLQADGGLSAHAPFAEQGQRRYVYDPANPVPTIGGAVTSSEPFMFGGAYDQRTGPAVFGAMAPYAPLAQRSDVLVFQTTVLRHAVELTGPVSAHLWISSDCLDTDFTIKLIDVYPPNQDYPNGYEMILTDGILRTRYRHSWEAPTLLVPHEIYLIQIEAFPVSNLFQVGHRIRIDVSSSNFPKFDTNPNTGAAEGQAGGILIAHNTLYSNRSCPSYVVLPVIPERL
ncbi:MULTISPECIES: CocE/NonD family hydrolase [unclassified Undibacterium]|uniref:CocE/NonD family hydrolase n=1 Tax=unclassified Undibacterium TaxID=2630295 RepID=UPI002AC9B1D7|nr:MULTISPECIES: CocE/NonD family hydrolase [unclassified Undibacterium]MEB0138308.1 CocE/NonD family hydrolase [Undibacterium sp. CCC2.1]MEB0170794.1 CocE/NonD family hydrolase [Undibacterium sp. CCC1.1]MEB0174683.1 CocE/NonD family hydrolase [Undibacterium sp. CCC3.4]MEB0213880.1 CocE/NonD family hydrolase [Undibacterium sp. 5I2]WPX42606.1 CocE/NonD family hydrolase [Undibacterium sp. CCC3.4]